MVSSTNKFYELQEKETQNLYEPAKWQADWNVKFQSISDKELNSEMPKILQNLSDTQNVEWQLRV